jgi:hypothetical protein
MPGVDFVQYFEVSKLKLHSVMGDYEYFSLRFMHSKCHDLISDGLCRSLLFIVSNEYNRWPNNVVELVYSSNAVGVTSYIIER